jgi:hypothetical protein
MVRTRLARTLLDRLPLTGQAIGIGLPAGRAAPAGLSVEDGSGPWKSEKDREHIDSL